MKNDKIRPIDANSLAEKISSLSTSIDGKELFPASAKTFVLQIISEQPEIPCAILLDSTIPETLDYVIKILTAHGENLVRQLDALYRFYPDAPVGALLAEGQELQKKINSVRFAIDKLKEQE